MRGIEGNSPEGMTILPELEFKTAGMETDLIGKAVCGGMRRGGHAGQQPRRDDCTSQNWSLKLLGWKLTK